MPVPPVLQPQVPKTAWCCRRLCTNKPRTHHNSRFHTHSHRYMLHYSYSLPQYSTHGGHSAMHTCRLRSSCCCMYICRSAWSTYYSHDMPLQIQTDSPQAATISTHARLRQLRTPRSHSPQQSPRSCYTNSHSAVQALLCGLCCGLCCGTIGHGGRQGTVKSPDSTYSHRLPVATFQPPTCNLHLLFCWWKQT